MSETLNERMIVESVSPLTFGEGEMVEERPARLLEAGDYPDKGLRLTEADLDGIAARFTGAGVPVKVEHVDSPLDPLGQVRRIWREGGALLGTLVFPADLAGFLRRRGAARLSVGLTREPLTLSEVSLVLKPRVASATLLAEEKREAAEVTRLRAELARREVDGQIAALKARGRLAPAAEGPARALLAAGAGAVVTLAEESEPVARVFLRFLELQPPTVTFGESVPAPEGVEEDETGFTQSEHMFLKRLGVSPADVAALVRRDKTKEGIDAH